MQIVIQSRDFTLTDSLHDYVRVRLGFAFSNAATRIQRINVMLSDINGTHGGEDKRCLIEMRVPGLKPIVVEDIQADLYTAIDRASARAGRSVMRRLSHMHRRWREEPVRTMRQLATDI